MKKTLALLILMIISLLTACGSENSAQKVGTLTKLNSSPEKSNVTFYDDLNSLQMALSAKNIDTIQTYGSVARYMTANNANFSINDSQTIKLVDDFCCAVRSDDVELKNSCDAAINSMKSDGTLGILIDKYIKNATETPETVKINKIDGADTIKVAVTGDLPPLDLILADGTPAGFNTAVLAEISKRIGKNIVLVKVNSSSRAAALISGQVDMIFWVVVPADDSKRPKNFDTPENITVTEPYYQDEVVDVNFSEVASAF